MDSNKLDIGGPPSTKNEALSPTATYKQIPEDDMEEQEVSRPKSLLARNEPDGAHEKMLPDEERKIGSNSNVNLAEVKFTNNDKQNGDAKLDIGEIKSEFVGLTKEELMKFANDPFWVRLRWILFVSFWLLWAGMLVGAVLIIVAAPKCAPPEPKTWWEEGPLAEADSTATAEDLDTLKANGVAGLIVPFLGDAYRPLNESEAFTSFLKLAEEKNLKVIVELVPGVSNVWFDWSEAKDGEHDDYYVWLGREATAGEFKPPNNWLSKNSTDENKISAWKYSLNRKQYYLAPTLWPQLNFRLDKVVNHFSDVLISFLDAGADGIRLRGAPNLLVDTSFEDEKLELKPSDVQQGDYKFYTHTKTENLADLAPLLKQWRDIVKNKTENGVFMLAEDLYTLDPYKINETLVIDLPRQSQVFMEQELTAQKLNGGIESALKLVDNRWPVWEVKAKALPPGVLDIVAYLLKGTMIIQRDVKLDQELIDTRKSPSIMFGSQTRHLVANDTVFAYVRVHSGNPGFVVAINPSNERVVVDFPSYIPQVTEEVTVQYTSKNYNETGISLRMKTSTRTFPMSAKSAVVLSYVPKDED